jgi:TPR repeat protein
MPAPRTHSEWQAAANACGRYDETRACVYLVLNELRTGHAAEARARLERACADGDALGCATLADALVEGLGGPVDSVRAVALADQACAQGIARACHSVGVAAYRGRGTRKDLVRSTQLYQQACDGGVMEACRDLANALDQGRAGPRDTARARDLWAMSCAETPVACNLLSWSYKREGRMPEAIEAAKRGCSLGFPEACAHAGELISDDATSLRYLRTGCAFGDESACVNVINVSSSPEELKVYSRELCARGNAEGCVAETTWNEADAGPTPAQLKHYDVACAEGVGRACARLCRLANRDPSHPDCVRACPHRSWACAADAGVDAGL